jgi:hypothetical protein
VTWGSSFTVGTASAVARVVLLRPSAVTHTNDMDQRHVELAFSSISGGLNVTAPPSRNVAPPGFYMLFLLNASGVPSAARMLKIA